MEDWSKKYALVAAVFISIKNMITKKILKYKYIDYLVYAITMTIYMYMDVCY